jgi:hypothetical protein
MDQLRRLFGKSTAPALPRFSIQFPNDHTAQAVRAPRDANAASALSALGLDKAKPALVIMGGAGKMEAQSMHTTRSNIEDGLSRFAQERGVAIIDGGTTAGVMGLLGFARQRRGYDFPLIGVAPETRVEYPGHHPPTRQAELDPNHSHFVLVEGEDFGAESNLLASLGWTIADEGRQPVLGVVINGGEIVKQEARARATGTPRFPLLVLDGSGRFADELAAAYRAGTSADPVLKDILQKGKIHVIPNNAPAESVRAWLENFFRK